MAQTETEEIKKGFKVTCHGGTSNTTMKHLLDYIEAKDNLEVEWNSI
jgi:hypothetical protein